MNKKLTILFTTLALAAPFALGGTAFAQHRAPQIDARMPHITVTARPIAQPARPTTVRKMGTVATIAYRGRAVRALTLTDGSNVTLARPSVALARTLQPGASVLVRGSSFFRTPGSIVNASITQLRAPAAAPRPFAMRGTIRSVTFGADGRADAVRLTNGTRIAIPDSLARSMPSQSLHRGTRIAVAGHRVGFGSNARYVADHVTLGGMAFNAR